MELVFEPLEEEEAGGFVVVAIENDRSGSGRQQGATPGPLIIPHRVGGGYTRPYTVFRRRVGLG